MVAGRSISHSPRFCGPDTREKFPIHARALREILRRADRGARGDSHPFALGIFYAK